MTFIRHPWMQNFGNAGRATKKREKLFMTATARPKFVMSDEMKSLAQKTQNVRRCDHKCMQRNPPRML